MSLEFAATVPLPIDLDNVETAKVAPVFRVNWLSRIWFSWQTPFMRKGYARPLMESDMYLLPNDFGAEQNSNKIKNASIKRGLWKAYGHEWMFSGIFQLISVLTNIAANRLLAQFLESANLKTFTPVGYALLMFTCLFVSSISNSVFFYKSMSVGMKIRTGLVALLYEKSMKLSSTAREDFNVGKITNIISTDVFRIEFLIPYVHMLWSSPLQIIIVLALIWNLLGPSVLAGFGLMVLFMPLQHFFVSKLTLFRKLVQPLTDARIKKISEVMQNIRTIKVFAWETSFLKNIMDIREKELNLVRKQSILRALFNSFSQVLPELAAILVFAVYSTNEFSTSTMFTALSLFQLLRLPLMFLPAAVGFLADANVALNRIQNLLDAGEVTSTEKCKNALEIKGIFHWPNFKLDLDLVVEHGKLVAIIGEVGSGKSSLLNAIFGEMKSDGTVKIGGRVGYCPQQPWIMNATVRQNILFGREMDQNYQKAIMYTSLKHDLEQFPDGDMTEIGERGLNLSGGQKTRINMARMINDDADIFIMDDALSSVDANVQRHLFDSIKKLKKTRILVTHSLSFLNECDVVYRMVNGKLEQVQTGEQKETKMETQNINLNTTTQKLVQEEERAVGKVNKKVYKAYFAACGTKSIILIIFCLLLTQLAQTGSGVWFTFWVEKRFNLMFMEYLGGYLGFGVLQAIVYMLTATLFAIVGINAAKKLHFEALKSVISTSLEFFDQTPLGRILVRFSKDMDSMDNTLSDSFRMFLITLAMTLSTFLLIIVVEPYILLLVCPLFVIYYFVQNFYRCTSRELKRIDSISRSPIFAHFSESLMGIVSIRAYNCQQEFCNKNKNLIDLNNRPAFMQLCAQRWLSLRLELIGNIVVVCSCLIPLLTNISLAFLGLIVSKALQVTSILNWTVRQATETEVHMNCVERINYYQTLKSEHQIQSLDWTPKEGGIQIRNLCLFYTKKVLHGINLIIEPGWRVGVCGRTGAGKSSLISALLKMYPTSGNVIIDNVDTNTLSLEVLRRCFCVIPQDPVLFEGTLRSNLDIQNQHQDHVIWQNLEKTSLKNHISSLPLKLDSQVTENGQNFSVGQRQLICLTRALLDPKKILILDEATANVDHQTDALVQSVLRSLKCTTITIAHRINTILDYDRVLVLDSGSVAEFDEPSVLLSRNSLFAELARNQNSS